MKATIMKHDLKVTKLTSLQGNPAWRWRPLKATYHLKPTILTSTQGKQTYESKKKDKHQRRLQLKATCHLKATKLTSTQGSQAYKSKK